MLHSFLYQAFEIWCAFYILAPVTFRGSKALMACGTIFDGVALDMLPVITGCLQLCQASCPPTGVFTGRSQSMALGRVPPPLLLAYQGETYWSGPFNSVKTTIWSFGQPSL